MQIGSLTTQVWTGKIEGCPVLLIRPDWGQSNLFKGSRIYGGSYNEPEAYLYFNRQVRRSHRRRQVMGGYSGQVKRLCFTTQVMGGSVGM